MLKRIFGTKEKTDTLVLDPAKIPQHVAIIMDGNGRWAKKRGLPRTAGHQQGVKALKRICYACDEIGVTTLSVFAFSTENWSRPDSEVSFLMDLFGKAMREELRELEERGVKVQIIGRRTGISSGLIEEMRNMEERTRQNTGLVLNICFNYGGRAEIVDAVKAIIAQGIAPEAIDEATFSNFLYTQGLPDVELMIRTSGEQRLSNFLMYQAPYAEMVFSPIYWPDFDRENLIEAVLEFQNRERRFGSV